MAVMAFAWPRYSLRGSVLSTCHSLAVWSLDAAWEGDSASLYRPSTYTDWAALFIAGFHFWEGGILFLPPNWKFPLSGGHCSCSNFHCQGALFLLQFQWSGGGGGHFSCTNSHCQGDHCFCSPPPGNSHCQTQCAPKLHSILLPL